MSIYAFMILCCHTFQNLNYNDSCKSRCIFFDNINIFIINFVRRHPWWSYSIIWRNCAIVLCYISPSSLIDFLYNGFLFLFYLAFLLGYCVVGLFKRNCFFGAFTEDFCPNFWCSELVFCYVAIPIFCWITAQSLNFTKFIFNILKVCIKIIISYYLP